jgi:hypothetical protein
MQQANLEEAASFQCPGRVQEPPASAAPDFSAARFPRIREILRPSRELARAVGRLVSFFPEAVALRAALEPGHPRRLEEPFKPVKLVYLAGMAQVGGVHADLAGFSAERRKRVCSLSARSQAVILIADYFVDEINLSKDEKREVVSSLLRTIQTGKTARYKFEQLEKLSAVAAGLHREIRSLPNGEPFFEAFRALVELEFREIEGEANLDLAAGIGGWSIAIAESCRAALTPAFRETSRRQHGIMEHVLTF